MEGSSTNNTKARTKFNINSPIPGESINEQLTRLIRLAKGGYSRKEEYEICKDDLTAQCPKCGGHSILEMSNFSFLRSREGRYLSVTIPTIKHGCTNPNCLETFQTPKFEELHNTVLRGVYHEKYGSYPDLSRPVRTWDIPVEGQVAKSTVNFDRKKAILFKRYAEEFNNGMTPLQCLDKFVEAACKEVEEFDKKKEKERKKAERAAAKAARSAKAQ